MYSQTEVPFPLGIGYAKASWEVVGLGLGGMWLRTTRSCSSNPLLPRNQHPSPTTSFTNIKQNQVGAFLLARDLHALTPGALGTIFFRPRRRLRRNNSGTLFNSFCRF